MKYYKTRSLAERHRKKHEIIQYESNKGYYIRYKKKHNLWFLQEEKKCFDDIPIGLIVGTIFIIVGKVDCFGDINIRGIGVMILILVFILIVYERS